MDLEDLAAIFELPTAKAVGRCSGNAREFFLGLSFADDQARCAGGRPYDWLSTIVGDTVEVRRDLAPKYWGARGEIVLSVTTPTWCGDLLDSFVLDGREVDELVVRLSAPGGQVGWIVQRFQQGPTSVVVVSTGLQPALKKRPRGRLLGGSSMCTMGNGDSIEMAATGLYQVSGGWLASLMFPRPGMVKPSDVRSLVVAGMPGGPMEFVPATGQAGDVAFEIGEPIVPPLTTLQVMIQKLLPALDVDSSQHLEAMTMGLLDASEGTTDVSTISEELLEQLLREAAQLVGLDDSI